MFEMCKVVNPTDYCTKELERVVYIKLLMLHSAERNLNVIQVGAWVKLSSEVIP